MHPLWSFPTRERGLKCHDRVQCVSGFASFPTRERGLKLSFDVSFARSSLSFPTRERGLKLLHVLCLFFLGHVVPHAGTWIEMLSLVRLSMLPSSFPTRERGLKYHSKSGREQKPGSFPTRERGLKLRRPAIDHNAAGSFPTRERGLKCCCLISEVYDRSRSPRGNVD